MRRSALALILFSLAVGHGYADDATKLKLQDPRYAEPALPSTLKLAAAARSASLVPDYPILQKEEPVQSRASYWWASAAAVLGLVAVYALRRKVHRGE